MEAQKDAINTTGALSEFTFNDQPPEEDLIVYVPTKYSLIKEGKVVV
jgi:hypothetical protein